MSIFMSTTLRLVREFATPLIIAIIWTVYNVYAQGKTEASFIIGTLGTSFFFVSWMTGQIIRVRRQSFVEDKLSNVAIRVESLIEKLEFSTENLINTVTGGSSVAYIDFSLIEGNRYSPMIVHHGDHTLYNIQIRICNIDMPLHFPIRNLFERDIVISSNELVKGMSTFVSNITIDVENEANYNIFFTARNGNWTQLFRIRRIAGQAVMAFIILREDEPIFSHIPELFPDINEKQFDSARRTDTISYYTVL